MFAGTAAVPTGTAVTIDVANETLTAAVGADGSWGATAATLADGAHRIVMTTADAAGNIATVTQPLTIDTIAPVMTIDRWRGGHDRRADADDHRHLRRRGGQYRHRDHRHGCHDHPRAGRRFVECIADARRSGSRGRSWHPRRIWQGTSGSPARR